MRAYFDDNMLRRQVTQYEALEVNSEKRISLRSRLIHDLALRAYRLLEAGQDIEAFGFFIRCTRLYLPREAFYADRVDPELRRLARRLALVFAERGDILRSLATTSVETTGRTPSATDATRRFHQIVSWAAEADALGEGLGNGISRLVAGLEGAMRIWPSRSVTQTLARSYQEQFLNNSSNEFGIDQIRKFEYRISRLFLWIDRPQAIASYFQRAISSVPQSKRRDILKRQTRHGLGPVGARIADDKRRPEDYLRAALLFRVHDPELSLMLCRYAVHRFPKSARANACVGQRAAKMKKTDLAIAAYRRALSAEPQNKRYAKNLTLLYQEQIFRLVEANDLATARKSVREFDRHNMRLRKQWGASWQPKAAPVHFALGYGLYNAGEIDQAIKSFDRSLTFEPSVEALLHLATIALKRRRAKEARSYLHRALKKTANSGLREHYWNARIMTLEADLRFIEAKGNLAVDAANSKALSYWQKFLASSLPEEVRAESLVRKAQIFFALKRPGEAIDALERALRRAPARKESYADGIALLVSRGHLPEALEIYHRMLGRTEIGNYLKIYCTFWIVDLARRARIAPDSVALTYLSAVANKIVHRTANTHQDPTHTTRWQTTLAKFVLKQISYQGLKKQCKTKSQRAEALFYHASQLAARGGKDRVTELWRQVIGTSMMAFFEYDMARYYLNHGLPEAQTLRLPRTRPSR